MGADPLAASVGVILSLTATALKQNMEPYLKISDSYNKNLMQ